MKITKAIIPVAGFGTRFLPATKAQPKEMLPVVDKPIIQYIVEEAVAAGITDIIFITGRGKRSIEDHFDHSFELEYNLVENNKKLFLKEIKKISKLANFSYVRQPWPLGDGDAIARAAHLTNGEPCAVLFGDDIIDAKIPTLKTLMEIFYKYNDPVLALEEVPNNQVSRYGIIAGQSIEKNIIQIDRLVEKPAPEQAPSNWGVIGRYIITPEILKLLTASRRPKSGELRLANVLTKFLKTKPIYGYVIEGRRYDCGNKLGLIEATIEYGLKHKELRRDLKRYLKGRF